MTEDKSKDGNQARQKGWLAELVKEAIDDRWCIQFPCSTCRAQKFRSQLAIRAVRAAGQTMPHVEEKISEKPTFEDLSPKSIWDCDPKVFKVWAAAMHNLAGELRELPDPVHRPVPEQIAYRDAVWLVVDEMKGSGFVSLGRLDLHLSGSWAGDTFAQSQHRPEPPSNLL